MMEVVVFFSPPTQISKQAGLGSSECFKGEKTSLLYAPVKFEIFSSSTKFIYSPEFGIDD